jgi:hypothetical protein
LLTKKLPIDSRNGSKPPSNLMQSIEKKLDFEKKNFKEFEGSFEHDKIVDINIGGSFLHFSTFMCNF